VSADPIGDALHADAEAARAEIRAAGVVCPSCAVNMADLPKGHEVAVVSQDSQYALTVQCGQGTAVQLTGFDQFRALANIQIWDSSRNALDEVVAEVVGTGPANFTGLLDILDGQP
jgi:hypothetical protein